MKFLVLAACVALSSSQAFYGNGYGSGLGYSGFGYAGYGASLGYTGYRAGLGYNGHTPGYGYSGYDAGYTGYGYSGYDTGYTGYGYSAAPLVSSASGIGYTGYAPNYAAGYEYSGPLNLNTQLIAHPNGAVVPLDEPAVAAARADHLTTKGAAYAASAPLAAASPLVASAPYAVNYGYAGPLNLNTQLVAHPNGAVVPLDEPAVAAARADHLASKGAAYAASAPVIAAAPAIAAAPIAVPAPYSSLNYGYSGPLNLNTQLVAHPNGAVVPVDEPAVAAARADHLATKGVYGGVYAAVGYGAGYAPYAGLIAHPNGALVPVDEPAVIAARVEHFAAHGF